MGKQERPGFYDVKYGRTTRQSRSGRGRSDLVTIEVIPRGKDPVDVDGILAQIRMTDKHGKQHRYRRHS